MKGKKSKTVKAAFAAAAASMTLAPIAASAHEHTIAVRQDPGSSYYGLEYYLAQHRIAGMLVEDRSCVTLSEFLTDPSQYRRDATYETLMSLYNSSAFSRQLMVDAAEQDVQVCDMNLGDTIAGVHIPSQNKIGLDFSRNDSIYTNMAYIAHEFAHYTQFLNGGEYFDANRSVFENQRAILAMETAAPVAEFIAILLAEENGDSRADQAFERQSYEGRLYRTFKRNYRDALRDGATRDEAINSAAQQAWVSMFNDQHKLDHYNNALIAFTLVNIGRINPVTAAVYTDPNLDQTIRGAGQLADGIDFARASAMPENREMFGNNSRMRQVFDALEWYRQSRIYGSDHEYVIALRDYHRANGNRYIDADFTEATRRIQRGETPVDAVRRSVQRTPRAEASQLTDRPYITNSISVTYRPNR